MWSTRDPGSFYCVALPLVLQRQVQSAGRCPQLRQPKMSRHCPVSPGVRLTPITVLADHSEAPPLCGASWHPLNPHCPLLPPASLILGPSLCPNTHKHAHPLPFHCPHFSIWKCQTVLSYLSLPRCPFTDAEPDHHPRASFLWKSPGIQSHWSPQELRMQRGGAGECGKLPAQCYSLPSELSTGVVWKELQENKKGPHLPDSGQVWSLSPQQGLQLTQVLFWFLLFFFLSCHSGE